LDLQYFVEVVHPKDKSELRNNYTEAVFKILKNKLSSSSIEQLILQLKNTDTLNDNCINKIKS